MTTDTFILTLERRGLKVTAGKHISVGLPAGETREYSLYSGEEDDYLDILVRRVDDGQVSRRLSVLQPGDQVQVKGPKGKFLLSKTAPEVPIVMIATGTGIAPFRSFLRTQPSRTYTLVHGVRHLGESLGDGFADPHRLVVCVSRGTVTPGKSPDGSDILSGRVTDWLLKAEILENQHFYLCGNQGMLEDCREILLGRGVEDGRIHREKYY